MHQYFTDARYIAKANVQFFALQNGNFNNTNRK